jgi:hypothetical protein
MPHFRRGKYCDIGVTSMPSEVLRLGGKGLDTVDVNTALGLDDDKHGCGVAVRLLSMASAASGS